MRSGEWGVTRGVREGCERGWGETKLVIFKKAEGSSAMFQVNLEMSRRISRDVENLTSWISM